MNDMLLCYFREEGTSFFASGNADGSDWKQIAKKPFLYPNGGSTTIRDPFIGRSIDGRFHVLYTEAWWGRGMGHASSGDLLHWGEQGNIPIMKDVPDATAVWAPEFYTDERSKEHMVYWTGFVKERPSIWYAHTTNFVEYTTPRVLFDPGYPVIDATIVKGVGRFIMAFKDERDEYKAVRLAFSDNLIGPYRGITECISPWGTEGPIMWKHDGNWHLYFDKFNEGHWGLMKSGDATHWHNAPLVIPNGARHGSLVQVTPAELRKLTAGSRLMMG